MKSWLGLLLALAVSFAAGCGKSDSEKFADSYCAEVAKCCVAAGMSTNGQLCHLLFAGGSYNPSAGQACLAEIKAQAAAGAKCTLDAVSSVCDAVVSSGGSGNKKPGENCQSDNDCATSSEGKVVCASAYDGSAWINKCQVQIAGKAGDTPCLGTQDGNVFSSSGSGTTTDVAASGIVCDTANGVECTSGACVALAGVGQSCSYASDCVRSAYCDASYHCLTRVAAAAACTGASADECVLGYYCPDSSPRQCTAQLALGASCSSDAMCKSGNCVDTTCKPNMLEAVGWAILCS
jgi:hypothetical protein